MASSRPHHLARRALLVGAALVAVAACGDDDSSEAVTTTTTVQSTTTLDSTVPEDSSTTDPVSGTVIPVVVESGVAEPGGRESVDLGDTVTLLVTSDVDEEIHLHGYDISVDVVAGETAELTFEATIPGVFEVEFEGSGLLLLELEIS